MKKILWESGIKPPVPKCILRSLRNLIFLYGKN